MKATYTLCESVTRGGSSSLKQGGDATPRRAGRTQWDAKYESAVRSIKQEVIITSLFLNTETQTLKFW